jgi:hypothetical protein
MLGEMHTPTARRANWSLLIDESSSLTVANRDVPFPAHIVLGSLSQIGLSSKEAGEAVGHKGIGFKATLEVSAAPEIYTTLADGQPTLAVRCDPGQARELILDQTPEWDVWVADQGQFRQDRLQAVPVPTCRPGRATRVIPASSSREVNSSSVNMLSPVRTLIGALCVPMSVRPWLARVA